MNAREAQLADVFVALADTLVADFDLHEFLHGLAMACVEVLDASAAGILLASPTGVLQVVASSDERMRLLELFELQNDEGPCTECHATGSWVREPDLHSTDRWPAFSARAVAEGFGSVDALPLRLRGTQLGALNLFRGPTGGLPQRDRRMAQALADVATIGLLQERALRESQLVAQQLQHALNSRVVIEQAKGILAEQAGTSVEDAFSMLREHARRNSIRGHDVAARIISGDLTAEDLR